MEELSTFSARLRHHYERSVHNLRLILGPGARKQALLGVFLMSMQQLSGIDGVIYVCTHLDFWFPDFPFSLDSNAPFFIIGFTAADLTR